MKRINLILGLIALFLGRMSSGQTICFDIARRQDGLEFERAVATSESSVGYLTLNLCDSSSWNGPRIGTTLFNFEGEYAADRRFSFGSGNFELHASGCRDLNGALVAVLGIERMGVAQDSIYLLRFDEFGDTTSTHLVHTGTVVHPTGIMEANNTDLLISAYNGQPRSAMFTRVSSSGTLLYSALVLAPSFIPYGQAESPTNELFFCGYGTSTDPYNGGLAVIVKCDMFGNLAWYRTTPFNAIYMAAVATDDGGVIAMGQMGNSAFVQKFDSDGNVIWHRMVYSSDDPFTASGSAVLRNGYIAENGDLIAIGNVINNNSPYDRGSICRISPAGDVIWLRLRSHYPQTAGYFPQRYYQLQPSQDGGLLVCGSTFGTAPDNVSHLWLSKLDEQGELGSDCILSSTPESTSNELVPLTLFPNPTSAECSILLPPAAKKTTRVEVGIRDAFGKVVRVGTYHVSESAEVVSVWLGDLSPGPYSLEISDGFRTLGRGKVLLIPQER